MGKSEFEVVKKFEKTLGLENLTDGTIVRYDRNKFKHTKPDGIFEYKNYIIVLDAKAEGKSFTNQLKDYLIAEKALNPRKVVFGIQYNITDYKCWKNDFDNLLIENNRPGDKEFYYTIANNIAIDKSKIYNITASLNTILSSLGLTSLLNRIVWTSCVLVASMSKPIKNYEKSYKVDVIEYLRSSISESLSKNKKLEILISEFEKIDLNHDSHKLKKALDNIEALSNLLISSEWNGEDVGAIFFNEFTRYKGKSQEGQVFTPEIWTDFLFRLIDVNFNDKVLDAACGSGGFLIKAMNLMIDQNREAASKIKENNLFGVENSRELYAVSSANMLLHKDGKTSLKHGDSTTEEIGQWIKSKGITKVLMNPPFEKSLGVEILKNVLDNVSLNSDVAFILPDWTFYKKKQKTVNSILKNHTITKIIKMPSKTWVGLADVSTSIFVFKTGVSHSDKEIVKYWIKEDGLSTVKNKGRHDVDNLWKTKYSPYWLNIIKNNLDNETKIVDKDLAYIVPRDEIKIYDELVDEYLLQRLMYEDEDIKNTYISISEKFKEIKDIDLLLWSLRGDDNE